MFAKFEYHIVHKPITIETLDFDAYVEIHLLNRYGNILKTLKKGLLSFDAVFRQYQETQSLVLDHCFVEDFCVHKLSEEPICLKRLSAKNAVFLSEEEVDFSNIAWPVVLLKMGQGSFADMVDTGVVVPAIFL